MNSFLKIPAWLFHPLWMPTAGVILFFNFSPRFFLEEIIAYKIIAVFILSFLIPILITAFLKKLKIIDSISLREVRDRKIPTAIQCLLFIVLLKYVFNPIEYIELYITTMATLISLIIAFSLVSANFKVSYHMIGISGLTGFVIILSIYYRLNLTLWIMFLLFANGWVASSRLHTKSHTPIELIFGFFVGAFPQLLLVSYWF